jgi:uncharacterized paraquat-inducible protein A
MTLDAKKISGILALGLSIVFFCLGMYFPLLSTKMRIIGINWTYETLNIFQSVAMFFEDREYFLALVILLFTFVMPVLKYIELIIRVVKNKTSKMLQNLDKWNMLDVFLVALLLLNFKMNSNIIVMELRTGTTFIALAVIFRMLTIILMENVYEKD